MYITNQFSQQYFIYANKKENKVEAIGESLQTKEVFRNFSVNLVWKCTARGTMEKKIKKRELEKFLKLLFTKWNEDNDEKKTIVQRSSPCQVRDFCIYILVIVFDIFILH